MEKERKAITLRVSPELKFQIEKAATEEGFNTINSWIIYVIKGHLENAKKKG
jgi:predicted HicB family RNase H-like nuclease